jgi:RNA recognition motif-containing protein
MSTQYPRSSGRRSGRGPRRPRRDDDRDPRDSREPVEYRTPNQQAQPKAPQKLSFWQKIVGLFSGKKPAARVNSRPQSRNSGAPTATTTSNYPAPGAAASSPRPARKPEAIEVTSPKVYVGNLSFDAAENDLRELFNGVGAVQTAEIVSHNHTQKSKGFGFVTMGSVDEAKRAVEVLHDKEFMGRKLVVSGAKTPVDRR